MLFQVSQQNKLELDPSLYGIQAIKQVLAKDKDRQKRNALKELLFVYFFHDYRSPFQSYVSEERKALIKEDIGLELDWEPCPKVKRLEDWYLKRQDSASIRSLKAVRGALVTTTQLIEVLSYDIEKILTLYRGGDEENINLSLVTKHTQQLLSLSEALPKAIDTITVVTEKVKKETTGASHVRGGGDIGEFED